jgi:hypothetical protein
VVVFFLAICDIRASRDLAEEYLLLQVRASYVRLVHRLLPSDADKGLAVHLRSIIHSIGENALSIAIGTFMEL